MKIPFNKPLTLGGEIDNIVGVLENHKLTEGQFVRNCETWFKENNMCKEVFLTPSCTSALEMAMLLIGIEPGDEVILPSFTFTSSATSIVLMGGVPVFVDCRSDTLNINEDLIEAAITKKTKAIMPVFYAGYPCDVDRVVKIADQHGIQVVADAAQAIGSYYKNKPLTSYFQMSALSFHETKNITCGEGGALCLNDEEFSSKARIVKDKGTNRQEFLHGMVDKYSWKDKGSSYLISELQAAYLLTQLQKLDLVTNKRIELWNNYHANLQPLEDEKKIKRPVYADDRKHSGHLYYILLNTKKEREELQKYLSADGIHAFPHYVPLHDSDAGQRFGRAGSSMEVTHDIFSRLLRLPMYFDLNHDQQVRVVEKIYNFFNSKGPSR